MKVNLNNDRDVSDAVAYVESDGTFASRMAQGGMSLHKVSHLLGHTSPIMTKKYAHIEQISTAEEARKMLNG